MQNELALKATDAEAENNYRQIVDKAWQAIDRSFVGENYNTQAWLQVRQEIWHFWILDFGLGKLCFDLTYCCHIS
ncbi:hypothetical protein F7734_07710 [Scytonema sp. UIC 10036]|uniref:hypothetical protein n=1 Tax=Scytonema sp. UIC 10036 TaxID=2304196 RepID=UPI0012DA6F68|nr:hypothetical protein [Scytonema sp. UIC 10036]MUG92346.1 hypothetical protein [Scytonema sp. UIC 10036]